MCNGNAPHITICDPHGRRTNDELSEFGQPMNVAAYQTLMFVPTAEVAATVKFNEQCLSNFKHYPVHIKANVDLGGAVRFDLFVSRPDVYLYNIVVVGEERRAGGIGQSTSRT